MSAEPIVHVVDDDEDVRDGLKLLIQSVGLVVQAHASATDFLARHDPARPGCPERDRRARRPPTGPCDEVSRSGGRA